MNISRGHFSSASNLELSSPKSIPIRVALAAHVRAESEKSGYLLILGRNFLLILSTYTVQDQSATNDSLSGKLQRASNART